MSWKTSDLPLLPGNNRYGITDLRLDMQALELAEPVTKWGANLGGRYCTITGGTWHFYTDDYKFQRFTQGLRKCGCLEKCPHRFWSYPRAILKSRAAYCVEPNYSCGPRDVTPRWQVVERIAKKRWLARMWQEWGIKIVVDLNVHPDHDDLVLLGVPKGWRSYATRMHSATDWQFIEDCYDMAVEHAGTEAILFAVFGGGPTARRRCRSNGWLWFRAGRDWRNNSDGFLPEEPIIHVPPRLLGTVHHVQCPDGALST